MDISLHSHGVFPCYLSSTVASGSPDLFFVGLAQGSEGTCHKREGIGSCCTLCSVAVEAVLRSLVEEVAELYPGSSEENVDPPLGSVSVTL